MEACVGMAPPVTKRKGGRGSSSKLVRLMVVSTLFVRGSITLMVFESSLAMKTRSFGSTAPPPGVWAKVGRLPEAIAKAPSTVALMIARRVVSMLPLPHASVSVEHLGKPAWHPGCPAASMPC